MVKLETLKDMDFQYRDDTGKSRAYINPKPLLKQKAIEWIKNCCPKKTRESLGAPLDYCQACNRFIEFFNFTEKELK